MTTITGTRVPGPSGLPLVGSLLDLKRDLLGTLLAAHRAHGDVVRITAGPPGLRSELYAVFSAEGAQQVLATSSANFRKDNAFYQEVRLSLGNGLLTSQDDEYLRQRRLVQPLFTPRRVDRYADALTAEATALTRAWRNAPGATVDVADEANELTLRSVARVLFGTDVESAVDVIARCFPVINDYVLGRSYAPVTLPREWPTPGNRRAATAVAELYAECDRIIARRRADGAPEQEDLLTLLTRAGSEDGDRLDPSEVRDQVLIFLLAGHETTASSLSFALHLLARHPREQRLAREEVHRVLGGRAPRAEDLTALPYLGQVVKEALRLYPAGPIVSRRAVTATPVGDHVVPAGADVFVAPWVTHRHTRYWPDPERFDPGRFTPEQEKKRHRYAWYPFGGGPRACIGQHFSMLMSTLALAVVLQEYELEAEEHDVPVDTGLTLHSTVPLRCRVRTSSHPRPRT
ncbi:cytochrome P450 [Streptomyces kanasensis]|uniref:cytochrome P450 n=1 Tax=Streptomyces kanasensis TaxID=936756 RepID=UPI0036FCDDCC